MVLFSKNSELQPFLAQYAAKSIGFVPTMGALHRGHISLINKAKKENELVVCSIFVNPTQFNNKEDLAKYPNTIERDKAMLMESGCDVLFVPTVSEIYSEQELNSIYQIELGNLDKVMEGLHRPGHFNGVAQVVGKLFDIVNPSNAYFGEKDFQQMLIIKKMAEQQHQHIHVIGCDIVRENDGLAMSSRNMRLSEQERKNASAIYKGLHKAQQLSKSTSIDAVKNTVKRFIQEAGLVLEYVEIADSESLSILSNWEQSVSPRLFVAAYAGSVRLIDNVALF